MSKPVILAFNLLVASGVSNRSQAATELDEITGRGTRLYLATIRC